MLKIKIFFIQALHQSLPCRLRPRGISKSEKTMKFRRANRETFVTIALKWTASLVSLLESARIAHRKRPTKLWITVSREMFAMIAPEWTPSHASPSGFVINALDERKDWQLFRPATLSKFARIALEVKSLSVVFLFLLLNQPLFLGSSSNSSTSVGTLNCKSFNVCSHCAVARHVYQENSKQSDNVSKTNNQGGSSSANQKKERVRPRSAKKRSQRSKGNNCKGLELETEKLRVLHDLEREARSLVETSSSCTDPLDFKSPHRGTKNLNRLVAAMSELLSSVEGMSFDLKTLQKEIHAMKSTKSQPNPQMKRVS